jgi:hypothetical protein
MRVAGFAVLVGFLAIVAWSAGLVPSSCCSSTCERCPVAFCKGTTANSAPRVDLVRAPDVTGLLARALSPAIALAATHSGTPSSRPQELLYPLRN